MEGIRYENILEYNRLKPGEEPAAGEKIYLQFVAGIKTSAQKYWQRENSYSFFLNIYMDTVRIHDKTFRPFLSEEEIRKKVKRAGFRSQS